jgi:hypothetical protein
MRATRTTTTRCMPIGLPFPSTRLLLCSIYPVPLMCALLHLPPHLSVDDANAWLLAKESAWGGGVMARVRPASSTSSSCYPWSFPPLFSLLINLRGLPAFRRRHSVTLDMSAPRRRLVNPWPAFYSMSRSHLFQVIPAHPRCRLAGTWSCSSFVVDCHSLACVPFISIDLLIPGPEHHPASFHGLTCPLSPLLWLS